MKNTKNKEDARNDFHNMIIHSWTYSKLTFEERTRVHGALNHAKLFGSWSQRWEQLHDIYYAFLLALEYKPIGWREDPSEENPKF